MNKRIPISLRRPWQHCLKWVVVEEFNLTSLPSLYHIMLVNWCEFYATRHHHKSQHLIWLCWWNQREKMRTHVCLSPRRRKKFHLCVYLSRLVEFRALEVFSKEFTAVCGFFKINKYFNAPSKKERKLFHLSEDCEERPPHPSLNAMWNRIAASTSLILGAHDFKNIFWSGKFSSFSLFFCARLPISLSDDDSSQCFHSTSESFNFFFSSRARANRKPKKC